MTESADRLAAADRQDHDGGNSLKRSLGLWAIVGLGLGFMTPTVIFDTYGSVAESTADATPTAYLFALFVLMFTAVSYGRMAGAIPSAGSAYTYVRESIHPAVGFLVGWAALLAYGLLPLVNCLIIRNYLEQLYPNIPPAIWVVIYCIVVTGVIYMTMKGTSNLNMILLVFSLVVMAVFVVIVFTQLASGSAGVVVDIAGAFTPTDASMMAIFGGAAIVCFSFIGFDAVTMYAEEAKTPSIVPKAIFYTVVLGGLIFFIAALAVQLRFPDVGTFDEESISNSTLPAIADMVGGSVMVGVFTAAGFCATLASGLATHASVARMLLVMGRNDVLPRRFFGHVSSRTRTPSFNIFLVGGISLLALFFDLDIIVAYIGFGALAAFTFVNVAVIAWFAVKRRELSTPGAIVKNVLLPGIGVIATGLLWFSLEPDAITGGLVWVGIGFVYLLLLTRGFRKPIASFDENQPVTGIER